jgi:hypothetical protein
MVRVNAPDAHPEVEALLKVIRAVEVTDVREVCQVGITGVRLGLDLEEAQEMPRSRTVQDIQLP